MDYRHAPSGLASTRVRNTVQPDFDPDRPRLGRRESEPHSAEITYLFDVLTTNFPDSRATWDLHHYFKDARGRDYDLQFDISFLPGLKIEHELTSYRAADYDSRIPAMVVNVMSKSTWSMDLTDHVEKCKLLEIPLYIVFPAYHVATWPYKPPFLRAYVYDRQATEYHSRDLKRAIIKEGENLTRELCDQGDVLLDTGGILPFRIGLMERNAKVGNGMSTWRMILVDPVEPRILPTRLEQERERAEQERDRAEQERERANRLQALVERYRERHGNFEE